MRRSKIEIYLHIVWAIQHREPLLLHNLERAAHRCIESQAIKCGCKVLAISGMPDHAHIVLQLTSKISIAELIEQVKGVSSSMLNNHAEMQCRFRWQNGY